jgi:endonuclease/exonuclease/phosphatase (EEP) superfamily protein YafD
MAIAPKTPRVPPHTAMPSQRKVSQPSPVLSLLKWPAILLLAAFLVSEVVTDSIPLLQWVWFVPRPLLAGAALLWSLLAIAVVRACGRRRPEMRGALIVGVLSVASLLLGVLQMWGLPKERPADSLRIVHWNASYPPEEDIGPTVIDALLDLDADIVVLTDAGQLASGDRALRAIAAGYQVHRPGRFAVFSRLPVAAATPIASARAGSASRIVIETGNGPISIHAIDLPSNPKLPREQTAAELASIIRAVEGSSVDPDVLVGDFNTPGGSHSLRVFGSSDHVDAFSKAGTGWGGTFPVDFPFWRIDLMLVREPWIPVRSEAIDLNGRRHRAQVVDLRWGSGG